jgi:putative pyruvate formate lyase activating enzyme
MYEQVGETVIDEAGLIKKGMIIRHLILPGLTGESIKILDWLKANIPEGVYISLMSQYIPCYKADCYPEINRRITRREYDKVLNHFFKLDFKNGYIQERDSAEKDYIPDFNFVNNSLEHEIFNPLPLYSGFV